MFLDAVLIDVCRNVTSQVSVLSYYRVTRAFVYLSGGPYQNTLYRSQIAANIPLISSMI